MTRRTIRSRTRRRGRNDDRREGRRAEVARPRAGRVVGVIVALVVVLALSTVGARGDDEKNNILKPEHGKNHNNAAKKGSAGRDGTAGTNGQASATNDATNKATATGGNGGKGQDGGGGDLVGPPPPLNPADGKPGGDGGTGGNATSSATSGPIIVVAGSATAIARGGDAGNGGNGGVGLSGKAVTIDGMGGHGGDGGANNQPTTPGAQTGAGTATATATSTGAGAGSTATARADGGSGGTGGDGGAGLLRGGDAGNGSNGATGTAISSAVGGTSMATAKGGDGGAGGTGGDATTPKFGFGLGGSGGTGGNGGGALARATTTNGTSATAMATGGKGGGAGNDGGVVNKKGDIVKGSPSKSGGSGGSAFASANSTNTAGATTATATAVGGRNALRTAPGTTPLSGIAIALANSMASGASTATATATSGARNFQGSLSFAQASAVGNGGLAGAVGRDFGLGVTRTLTATSTAPLAAAGGAAIVGSQTAIAQSAPLPMPLSNYQAGTFAIGSPLSADVLTATAGKSNVISGLGIGNGGNALGLLSFGGSAPSGGAPGGLTYTSVADFGLDTTMLPTGESLRVGLLDSSSMNGGFDHLSFLIDANGTNLRDYEFSSVTAAQAFFNDNVLDLGQIGSLPSSSSGTLDLTFELDVTASQPNQGFGADLVFNVVPEPSSWLVLATGLGLVAAYRHSLRRGTPPKGKGAGPGKKPGAKNWSGS
jgi:hypothetical protein